MSQLQLSRAIQLARDLLGELKHSHVELSITDVGILNAILEECGSYTKVPINRRDPMNRLPVELVESVFIIATETIDPSLGCHARYAVPLSHVCRRWRQIALNLPNLWTFICEGYLPISLFLAFVQRSQKLPLSVDLTQCQWSNLNLQYLQTISGRIGRFDLYVDRVLWYASRVSTMLSLNLPELEHCVFRFNLSVDDFPFRWPTFLESTPRLKTLRLDFIPYLPPVQFPSLTHLTINTSYLALSEVLALLSQSPLLQEIKLEDACKRVLSTRALSFVKLDRLAILTIMSTQRDILEIFISHVDFNPMATVHISDSFVGPWAEFPAEVSQLHATLAATTLYIVYDKSESENQITMVGVASKSLPAIHLRTPTIENALYLFPSDQITEMWLGRLDVQDGVSDEMVVNVLERLPALRTLAFDLEYIKVFSSVLSRATSPEFALCPRLEVIRVCWHMWHGLKFVPPSIFIFVENLFRTRPTIQVYAGNQKYPRRSIPLRYEGRSEMIPNVSFDAMNPDDYRLAWETCFGVPTAETK